MKRNLPRKGCVKPSPGQAFSGSGFPAGLWNVGNVNGKAVLSAVVTPPAGDRAQGPSRRDIHISRQKLQGEPQ